MDQPKFERLLRLMKMLTANRNYSPKDLAERLDTSVRTIYRYIDTFRLAGFVVKKHHNYIYLDTSSPYFKDISELIHFTEEEAFILKSAIESIDENNLLKQNLKKKLYTVYDYKILAETTVSGKNAKNIHQLTLAIENKKQVILKNYASAHGKNIRNRQVEPFSFTTNYVQVWCYDIESKTSKLFKTSGINSIDTLPNHWEFEQLHHAGFIDIFRINSDKKIPIQLKMSIRAVHLLQEEYPLSSQFIKQIDKNHWLFTTNVCGYEGVGRFILGLFDEITIVKGEGLKAYLQKKLKKMIAVS